MVARTAEAHASLTSQLVARDVTRTYIALVSGILDIPRPIAISNVMLVCPECGAPTRVRHGRASDGRSIRTCAHCGQAVTRTGARK